MKQLLIMIAGLTFLSGKSQAQQTTAEKAIKQTLEAYIKAGDQNDATALGQYMHPDFRVALYDGKEDIVKILDRTTYSSICDPHSLNVP